MKEVIKTEVQIREENIKKLYFRLGYKDGKKEVIQAIIDLLELDERYKFKNKE